MTLENTLGKAIEYKFKTRAEINEAALRIFEKVVLGFGDLMAPIANPLARMLDQVYDLAYKI